MATLRNTGAITFPIATSAGIDVTHWGMWSAQNGGSFLGGGALTNDPDPIEVGKRYQIPAAAAVVTFPRGQATDQMAVRQATGAASPAIYYSLHTGAPGQNGANEINPAWYSRVPVLAAGQTIAA